ncbi:MAG: sigma-54-dependent Fis family transcriptional regulator [Gemmatimonadaceae bacterium]|nr:sigma-54-dependent Fis family transcriptional regulator [Gemmatimonadaceae bacterium]
MSHGRTRLLFVEDDAAIRFAVRDFLDAHAFDILEADSCATGEQLFLKERPDLVLTDYMLGDGTALDLLPRLRAVNASIPIIVLTGHGTVELAVQAMKEGADDFLTKPIALPALLVILQRATERQRDRQQQLAQQARQRRTAVDPFVGTSAAIQHLRQQAERVATAERPILVQGETGAGKGILTRWIHANGRRTEHPFVDLNCASLPRELLESELFGHERGAFTGAVAQKTGLVELAHRGTLFLDEVGDLELSLQPKLLKVLEEQAFRRVGAVRDRQVDVRLIAATHQDLPRLVSENKFRSDLYFRISTIPITIPPLRHRVEDIPVLARQLLDRLAFDIGRGRIELAADADRALATYRWPGNIRELRNVLERAVLFAAGPVLRAQDLSFESAPSPGGPSAEGDLELTLEELQRRHIVAVLQLVGGHVEQAAARLGVPRSSLYQKLKAMQIVVPKGRGR